MLLDPIYFVLKEGFQCVGLFFIMLFAWRSMVGASGPHLTSSLLKPMWRFLVRNFRWLVKHSWKFADEISRLIAKRTPDKYRPFLQPACRCLICLVIICAVCALFRL